MVRPTTLLMSLRLNRCLGVDILLAFETFQHTGNFKFRGAWHMALAFACQELNKRCTVVMPEDSVMAKVDAVREFGGQVELVDAHRVTRDALVAELARQYPDAYVANRFDDDLMI
jgi:threonine dehydratase